MTPLIGPAIEVLGKVLDRVLPDKAAKDAAQLELMKMTMTGEVRAMELDAQLAVSQNEVNKAEAQHESVFVAGWRPFIGWTLGTILVVNYLAVPFLAWISPLFDLPPPERLEFGELMPVLLGMLGLGTLRTVENVKGRR